MNRADIMAKLPAVALAKIHTGKECSIGDPDKSGGLTTLEKLVLAEIIKRFGPQPFTRDRLFAQAEGELAGSELDAGLVGLLRKAVLFRFRKLWGEYIYVLPDDVFFDRYGEAMGKIPHKDDGESSGYDFDFPPVFLRDLLRFLKYIAFHEVSLTRSGTIHKRHVHALCAGFEGGDEIFSAWGFRYPRKYKEAYPLYLAVVLDTAFYLEAAEIRNHQLNFCGDKFGKQWGQPTERLMQKIFDHLRRQIRWEEGWLQHALWGFWHLSKGAAADDEDWLNWFKGHFPGPASRYSSEELTRAALSVLKPLAALGMAELAAKSDEQGAGWRFTWKIHPAQMPAESVNKKKIWVQPDFEIILPPDAPLDVQWEVLIFAKAVHQGVVSRYKLDRESVEQALCAGFGIESLLHSIRACSIGEIPESVEQTLREWGERHDRVRCEEVLLLRCRDAQTALEIEKNGKFGASIAEKLGDRDLLVKSSIPIAELRALMANAGYAAGHAFHDRNAGQRMENSDAPVSEPAGLARLTLLEPAVDLDLFQPESDLPAPEDIYPGLPETPRMWIRDMRRYHATTRKELIKKALEWDAYLILSDKGTKMRFKPVKLDDAQETWQVSGRLNGMEKTLDWRDWEEMQLILPGINDK